MGVLPVARRIRSHGTRVTEMSVLRIESQYSRRAPSALKTGEPFCPAPKF